MLILTRKKGESIVIPHANLVVTVLAVKGNQIRLGFSAPDHMSILRQEVWEREKEGRSPMAKSLHSECPIL
jgi:carbon storage regulator